MKKENREKLYKIGEVADLLGVHEDTLRNWEKEGYIKPERIGKRGDRRYTAEHVREIKGKGLVSDLAKKGQKGRKDFSEYTKEELVKELQLLKKQKKYGLVWEDHKEEVVERCKTEAPILVSKKEKQIKDKDLEKPTNILIEGDNYHALQVLNYTHKNKIDVIYIDPPYNTGAKDWKYNNDYIDASDSYRHSKWLSFLSHRLRIAKKLLSPSGVLLTAIDDHEFATLKLLLEEVFPSHTHESVVVNHHPQGSGGDNISITHEYGIVSVPRGMHLFLGELTNTGFEDWALIKYGAGGDYYRSGRPRMFFAIHVDSRTGEVIDVGPELGVTEKYPTEATEGGLRRIYPLDAKGGERRWRYGRETMLKLIKQKKIASSLPSFSMSVVVDREGSHKPVYSNWIDSKYNAGPHGTKVLKDILPNTNFPYPKSIHVTKDFIAAATRLCKSGTVLDFFAGSGTTGHAVLDLNKEDGGNRKFILCTNNENNIAEEVTWERIKRVSKGYKKPNGEKVEGLGGSLEYFKTEFVDVENIENVSDKKKLEFTYEAGQMIAFREDSFKEIEKNKNYQIFTNEKGKYVGIYFRENLEKLSEMEKKILDKKEVKLYIFSHGGSDFKNDYSEYANVSVENIPEPILKIYKKLNS